MLIGPKGASCGTAVYRKEPVYVTDILSDPIWDDYRHLVSPYGIRAAWARPVLSSEGKVLGTFAILYRDVRHPDAIDLQLIEGYGSPSDAVLDQLQAKAPMLGENARVVVHEPHAGFGR